MKYLIMLILAMNVLALGQSYNLNIKLNDGNTVVFSVDEIRKLEFTGLTSINNPEDIKQAIESFNLLQNYPNPFNPTTTIVYQIPDHSKVTLSIYDLNGQLVKEILNETQDKGEYRVTWNGTDQRNLKVSSGVYIYTVRCNDLLLSKHMILLK